MSTEDWFGYQDRKTPPTKARPSHQRPRPSTVVRPPPANPRSCEGMLVEEVDSSTSMIERLFGKKRAINP
jgi:hypothetical protein